MIQRINPFVRAARAAHRRRAACGSPPGNLPAASSISARWILGRSAIKAASRAAKARSRRIPNDIVALVMRRADGRCEQCGTTEDLQIDHVVPFSQGGSNSPDNLQFAMRLLQPAQGQPRLVVRVERGWLVRGLGLTGNGRARMLESRRGLALDGLPRRLPAAGSPARAAGGGASCAPPNPRARRAAQLSALLSCELRAARGYGETGETPPIEFHDRASASEVTKAAYARFGSGPRIVCVAQDGNNAKWNCSSARWGDDPNCRQATVGVTGSISFADRTAVCEG